MKKIQSFACLALVIIVLVQANGCKKVAEELLKDPCSDIKFCNLKSITFSGIHPSYPANTATFTYDLLGNPLSVSNTQVSTGYPNLLFKYDATHRLTEFIRPYNNGQFETWQKFIYDAGGKIATDTIFALGTVTPAGPVNSFSTSVTTYTYDAYCRVIKTSLVNLAFPATPSVQTYTYDLSGNLIKPGVVYDNKVNIHRTNKIFMFVDRDYSMNNPFMADTYNGYSLPWTISSPSALFPKLLFLQRPIDNASFVYQCD